jgi:hypothetical protein
MGDGMAKLTALTWPAARLGEALESLARAAGLGPHAVEPLPPIPTFPRQGGRDKT